MKFGSVVFLAFALVLAVASGDMLLVLAVATAVAGLLLLTTRRAIGVVRRPAASPIVERQAVPQRTPASAGERRLKGRMAVRRYGATTVLSRRSASPARRAGGGELRGEPASQPQVARSLQ